MGFFDDIQASMNRACGAPVVEGDAFCMSCGQKLGEDASAE